MPDKRRAPRPCQGTLGNNPTVYKLGNGQARKRVRTVAPIVAAFKEARLASGMSQVIAAERAGYDPETLSRFERGMTSVSVATFSDFCAVVGLALAVLPVAGMGQSLRVSGEVLGGGSQGASQGAGQMPELAGEQANLDGLQA